MLLSIVVPAALSLILYLSGFLVVFTPLPLLFAARRHGLPFSLVAFLLCLVSLFLLYYLPSTLLPFLPLVSLLPKIGTLPLTFFGLLYFFYYGWLALGLAVSSQRSGSLERSLFEIIVSSLVVPGLILFVFSKATGLDPIGLFREGFQGLLDQVLAFEEKSHAGREEVFYLRQYAENLMPKVVSVLPAFWVATTLLVSSLNILFFRRWITTEGFFSGWPDFGLWRLKESSIWIPISVISLFFIRLYLFPFPILGAVLLNLLLVLGVVYFFQGLSIVTWFFRRKFSPLARMISYLFMFLFAQMVGVVIVVIGLFDFWFDFRKLKK